MTEFTNINDILDFAIQNEQNAVEFYNELAKTARTEDMRSSFVQFAQEEMGHKARLIKIKEEGIFNLPTSKVTDLKIADYLVRTESKTEMSYEQTLVLAMKREKAAFKLYSKLAERAPSPEIKNLFLSLALEESRHKLRLSRILEHPLV